jgi:hypothetical protein
MHDDAAALARFMGGDVDPAQFGHRDHVRMGFEMLRRYNFSEAAHHYSMALRTMATRAGRPDGFHQTVTIAFLSLIAERMLSIEAADFDAFERASPDLLVKSALTRWYRPERLAADAARRSFLLPDCAE